MRRTITRIPALAAAFFCVIFALVSCETGDTPNTQADVLPGEETPPAGMSRIPPGNITALSAENEAVFEGKTLYKVAYGKTEGGGVFVATSPGSRAFYSEDGIVWHKSPQAGVKDGPLWPAHPDQTSTGENLSGLAYGGGIFVITGGGSGNRARAWSKDGIVWHDSGGGTGTTAFNGKGISYGKNAAGEGIFVQGGSGGRLAFATASGVEAGAWTFVLNTETQNANNAAGFEAGGTKNGYVNAVTSGGGIFLAAGSSYGHTAWSQDGIHWEWNDQSEAMRTGWLNGAAYGNVDGGNIAGGRFVIVGEGGGRAAWSNDGKNWTAVVGPEDDETFGESLLTVVYLNGYFIAAGNRGNVFYSKRGWTWTKVETPLRSGINGIAVGAGKYVFAANGGHIATAPLWE